jgi:hypothetical protein
MSTPPSDSERRQDAEESMVRRFTRAMRATVSPYGMLTDPPLVALATAVVVMVVAAIGTFVSGPIVTWLLVALALVPVAVAVVVDASLRRARAQVVDWLVTLPFPVQNMNGLLNGVGDRLRVCFRSSRPSRAELNAALGAVHADCFALEFEGDGDLEVEMKIGVLDSKLNPTRAHYQRYRRVVEMVERVLVPLADEHPIDAVWIC